MHDQNLAIGLNAFWIAASYIAGIVVGVAMCNKWLDEADPYDEYECTSFSSSMGAIFGGLFVAAFFIYPHVGFIVDPGHR